MSKFRISSLLGYVLFLGVVGLIPLDVTSAATAITKDGCYILESTLGFNTGQIDRVAPLSDRAECTGLIPPDILDYDSFTINESSDLVQTAVFQPLPGVYNGLLDPLFTGTSPCRSFYGRTNDNPTKDYGVIDFDNDDPSGGYRGCATLNTTKTVPGVSSIYDIDGWAWNTNLAWVSLGAEGGSPARNRGIAAGDVTYKSEIRIFETPEVSPARVGELMGYWWNDSLGWIKLNCKADTSLNTSDVDTCGTVDYGVKIWKFDPITGRAILTGYAWSESFDSYLDFKGVEVDLDGVAFDYEPKVSLVSMDADGDRSIRANGQDGYDIRLKFYDGNKDVTDKVAGNSKFGFCLYFRDVRKTNNVEIASLDARYSCADANLNDYDNLDLRYVAFDPTDNYLKGNTAGLVYDATLKAFKLVPGKYVKSELSAGSNDLFLSRVYQYSELTGQEIIKNINNVGFSFGDPFRLSFVPGHGLVEPACKSDGLLVDLVNPMDVSICGKYFKGAGMGPLYVLPGEVKVNKAYDAKIDSAKTLVFNEKTGLMEVFTGRRFFSSSNSYASSEFAIEINLAPGVNVNELEPLKDLLDLKLASKVEYTTSKGRTVVRKGPEVADETLNIFELNIQGSLTDRAFASGAFRSGVRDSGGIGVAANKRTAVVKSLRNVRVAAMESSCGNLFWSEYDSAKIGELVSNCRPVGKSGNRYVYYLKSGDKRESVVLFSHLKELMNVSSREGLGMPVIVLEGINLVWDEDYMTDEMIGLVSQGSEVEFGAELKGVPGIVLLESERGVGGNMVIPTYISDVLAYIYADGRLLSASDMQFAMKAAMSSDPDSVLDRNLMPEEAFYNQLALVGQLYSANCMGCSTKVPALRADGSISNSRSDAMNDDLNAFRYTPLNFQIVSGTLDVFGFPMDKVCYLGCGERVSDVFKTDGNGDLTSNFVDFYQCAEVGDQINQTNACLDKSIYRSGSDVELSRFLDAVAKPKVLDMNSSFGNVSEPQWQFGLLKTEGVANGDYDSEIRSMNLYYLPVDADVPVFGALKGR